MSKLLDLFLIFLKIGAFTFGGGYAMIPQIQREIVDKRKWMNDYEFVEAMAVAQTAPGAIAINTAVYCGFLIAGIGGAITAALAAILPSLITLMIIAKFYGHFGSSEILTAFFKGVRPAIIALIISAAIPVGKQVLKDRTNIVISIIALLALLIVKIHPILVVCFGAITGYISYRFLGIKGVDKNAS